MRIGALRRHWERFGRRDPYWAVLTDPEKRRGQWDVEGFFRSGAEEIDAVLARAERLGLPIARERALDFGCGAGRLTQAMTRHFARCCGAATAAPSCPSMWRRGLDRVRGARDALVVSARDRFYVPYAPPAINWWRRGPFSPRMEMYCVPRAEVPSILTSAGGRLVDVEEHPMPPYRSYRYWVSKESSPLRP